MWMLRLRKMARAAGREALILFFALRDPATPLSLKVAAGAALAYLVSPVDLLPDVPLIGWVDDALILSLGLPYLVRRLPDPVRRRAEVGADRVMAALGFPEAARAAARRGGAHAGHAGRGASDPQAAREGPGSGRARGAPGRSAASWSASGDVSDAKILSEVAAPRRR